jgi:hypothetical protein
MQIWDILNQKVYICRDGDRLFLSCFDPEKSYYLFEPLSEKIEPHCVGLRIPTLSTVYPDESRYKGFVRHGAKNLYMPVWNHEELLCLES